MFEEGRLNYFSSLESVFKIRARSWALSGGPAVPRSTGVVKKQGRGPWEKPRPSVGFMNRSCKAALCMLKACYG